jgi:hypothetical protein
MINKKNIVAFILIFSLAIGSCKKWDDHTAVTNQDLNTNLLQALSANAELSKFREYVLFAGLDTLLQSSKTFTIWAPTNTALQSLDPAIAADKAKLKAFLLNHISYQLYFTKDVTVAKRIAMVGGKYNLFSTSKFDLATLVTPDKYYSNGVLHTIDAMVPPLQNIWEFINSTTSQYAQNAYAVGLNFNSFDPATAIVDSISVLTGLPVYRPGTGIVQRNRLLERTSDLRREDRQYTYFVIQNANFVVEADSLKPYYVTAASTTTDSLTRWNVIKDLVYDTAYSSAAAIPATLTSKSGVSVPFSSLAVVEVKRLSNGYVYIMSKVDVPTANKFLPIVFEGENPSGFLQNDKSGNIHYRIRKNPLTFVNYSDILITGHAVTTFYAFYRQNETPSIKYQVYGKATNDFVATAFNQTINAWHQGLGALQGSITQAVPLHTAAGAYDEKNLGTITISAYGTVDWRVTAVTTGNIMFDYLRLVPLP